METFDKMNITLRERILSECNIYGAIYCLESYVFEKGLLDTSEKVRSLDDRVIANNDLELYYALGDKFNHELIQDVIHLCVKRLTEVLSSNDELFEISVYFKLKGYDEEGGLKFRPLHTARLIDLICMVSMLTCLMYDDKDKRYLSDLSKLIPHNFYGNLPSTDVRFLFKRWQTQYKEYTQNVIEHCRSYQENHRFLTEVSLDIKNFFPSVSPHFLYSYIVDKLMPTYQGKDENKDVDTLRMVVAKLLYFKMTQKNVEPWVSDYYGNENIALVKDGEYMNCGIPQGLPQSYFFGNLCMIEVKKLLMEDSLFKGDAYFYVDDSVIYIQSELKKDDFKKKIISLNSKLEDFCKCRGVVPQNLLNFIPQKYIDFQLQLSYVISFHEEGKSSFCHIDNADNHLGGFENLARATSMASNLYWNLEDIDDSISYKKCMAVSKVVEREIEKLKAKEVNRGENELKEKDASRLKLLKRFKKFFLYRVRMLKMKTKEVSVNDMLKDFRERFMVKKLDADDLVLWFERNDEEIFQSEYRLLIQNFSEKDSKELVSEVKALELTILKLCERTKAQNQSEYLYFQKDVTNSIVLKRYSTDPYCSLKRWFRENYKCIENFQQEKQFDAFTHFLDCDFDSILMKGFYENDYRLFVLKNSSECQRQILNAYYSESIHVLCSDAYSFIKANSRKLHYTELRILARLRNRLFDLNDFRAFVRRLDDKDVSNKMGIDMALLSVIGTFIHTVRNPEWIDGLLQTHRITKGLWYNGSKFLNSYTLHNEEHAVTLINQSVHIVKTIDYFVLKPIDYYILFLSCYLHDISMVIHPNMYLANSSNTEVFALISEQMLRMQNEVDKFKTFDKGDCRNARLKESWKFLVDVFNVVYGYFENNIRNKHPFDSADFVLKKSNSLLNYLEPTLLSFVAKVSESHGWNTIDVYGLKSRAKNDVVSLKYLMILIRLADLFDVANNRVNYHLLRQNLNYLPLISKFHWISHLVTDKLELDAEYSSSMDENAGLTGGAITECIIVKLYLNVKYLTSLKKRTPCKGCRCSFMEDYIDIDIGSEAKEPCNTERCALLCHWMTQKHGWIVNELMALNEYLFSVNNSLIKTNVKFRLIFSNEMELDADLFDCVVEFLDSMNK